MPPVLLVLCSYFQRHRIELECDMHLEAACSYVQPGLLAVPILLAVLPVDPFVATAGLHRLILEPQLLLLEPV